MMNTNVVGKPLCRVMMAVAIMLLSLQAMAFSYTHQGKTLYYSITFDNTVEVTYYNNSNYVSGDVVIPSTVTYNGTTYSVTSIGERAFSGCSGLTSVTIGNNVTSIERSAFSGCSGLTSVTIGNSVTYIGDWAFADCSGLTSVTIPNSVTYIGRLAFEDCSGLTTLNFNAIDCQDFEEYYYNNNGNHGNRYYPFSGTSLTTVNIGDSVQRIPANFVIGCSGLTSVTIGNSVTSIGERAFRNCSSLTSITIPTGVTSIGDSAFYNCSSLTSVTIPNSVTSIGDYAFEDCSGLTSVTIPNSVTSIGRSAFRGCSGLTSVTIPNSVTSIGESAFSDCSGLTSVTIPNSVTSIGRWAFDNCSGLTSVTIPNSVTSIGKQAFYGCSGLTSVSIPNSVTSIGESAFSGCSGLTSVTIPNSVTSIGDYAFSGCSGLTSVTIPNSVTSIGERAFSGCSGLTTLNFNAINCQDFEGYRESNYYYPFSGTSLTTVNIGDSVQHIPANFVRGCSGLTTLNFNAINCQDFESYYYNGNYYFPFRGTSLTTVNIGDSVRSIPANFVRGCSGLTSVTIPNSVTSIGRSAFFGCSGLTTLNFNARNCQDFEVYNNYYYYPFSGTSLTTVNIGDSVQRIPAYFVTDCSRLTSVTIGNSVTSIGNYAFYGCNNLSSITSLAMTPPAISNNEFPYPNFCTVTVPCGSLAAYTTWNIFFPLRITESSSFELSVSVNDEAYGRVEVENHSCESKTLTAIANEGYEFTGWNDGNMENPRTVNLTSDTAFVAIFTEAVSTPTITLTVNDATMGSATYTLDGNTAVLTATANEGYVFTGWNDGNTENPRTVTVTIDTAFTAIFAEAVSTPTITLTVNDATMGSATYTMDGNTAVLTATPNEGYVFTGWNDGNTENPRTVTVTSDTAFTAIFTETEITPTITVTVNDATMGSATYTLDGNTAVLTATPNEGYVFTGWNDGNTENPRTVTITSDTAFMAIFTETVSTPTITLTVNDETMGSASYTIEGNTAVLTATPNEGYEFTAWNDGNTENPRTVTITSDTAFMAIFTASGSSSLQEVNAREFAIYPNPAKSFVTLEFETLQENTLLQILDINGRRVRTLDLKAGVETLRIDVSDLPKGLYTIMLGNVTKKLIVE